MEHKNDILKGNLNTALAQAAYTYDIDVKWGEAAMVHQVDRTYAIPTLEAMEIEKCRSTSDILNTNSPEDLPPSWRWVACNNLCMISKCSRSCRMLPSPHRYIEKFY